MVDKMMQNIEGNTVKITNKWVVMVNMPIEDKHFAEQLITEYSLAQVYTNPVLYTSQEKSVISYKNSQGERCRIAYTPSP